MLILFGGRGRHYQQFLSNDGAVSVVVGTGPLTTGIPLTLIATFHCAVTPFATR